MLPADPFIGQVVYVRGHVQRWTANGWMPGIAFIPDYPDPDSDTPASGTGFIPVIKVDQVTIQGDSAELTSKAYGEVVNGSAFIETSNGILEYRVTTNTPSTALVSSIILDTTDYDQCTALVSYLTKTP